MTSLPSRTPRAGFTLVELLVVIAIVAVLVGLLSPVIGRMQTEARTPRSLSNLREIGKAMLLYPVENDGNMVANVPGMNPTGWRSLSLQYMSSTLSRPVREAMYLSPNAKPRCTGGNLSNYAVHPWLDVGTQYKASRVQTPSTCVMVADATAIPSSAFKDARTELWRDWVGLGPDLGNGLATGRQWSDKLAEDNGEHPANNRGSKFAYRNGVYALAVMFDGSIRKFRAGEMVYGNFAWTR